MRRKHSLAIVLTAILSLAGGVVNVGRVFAANTYGINYSGGDQLSINNVIVDPTLSSLKAMYSSSMTFSVSNSNLWKPAYYDASGQCSKAYLLLFWDDNLISPSDDVFYMLSGDRYDMKVQFKKITTENSVATQANPYAVLASASGGVSIANPSLTFSDSECTVPYESLTPLRRSNEETVFIEFNAKLLRHGTNNAFISEGMFFGITDVDAAQSYQLRNRIAGTNKSLLSPGNIYVVSENKLDDGDPDLDNMLVQADPAGYNYIYSQYNDSHAIAMSNDNRLYIGLDTNVQEHGIDAVFGFVGSAGSSIRFYVNQATIRYRSDINGTISGIKNETIVHGEKPSGSESAPNTHFEFKYWVADVDATLDDNSVITAGQPMTSEDITHVIVNQDVTFTAIHEAVEYHITYGSDLHGIITGTEEESIVAGQNPSGSESTPEEYYELVHWVADVDVTLDDGSVIPANQPIAPEDVKHVVVDQDIAFTAVHEMIEYHIEYTSDPHGTITGTEEENVVVGQNPSGSEATPEEYYELVYWTADVDVILEDDMEIPAGQPISPEDIKNIVVDQDITFTAIFEKIQHTISYESEEGGEITGITEEPVDHEGSPSGSEATPDEGVEFDHWVADIDIILEDGTEIKAGEPITPEQVKQIIVDQDLTLTAIYREATSPAVPNTGNMVKGTHSSSNSTTITTIGGILVAVSALSFVTLKKLSLRKQANSRIIVRH